MAKTPPRDMRAPERLHVSMGQILWTSAFVDWLNLDDADAVRRHARVFAAAIGAGKWRRAVVVFNKRLARVTGPLPQLRWRDKTLRRLWKTRTLHVELAGWVLKSPSAWSAIQQAARRRSGPRRVAFGAIMRSEWRPPEQLPVPLGFIAFTLLLAPQLAVRVKQCAQCGRFFFDASRNQRTKFCTDAVPGDPDACRVRYFNQRRPRQSAGRSHPGTCLPLQQCADGDKCQAGPKQSSG